MKKGITTYLFPYKKNEYKPHIFREVGVLAIIVLIAVTLLASASFSVVVRDSGLFSAVLPSVLVDLANEARTENGFGSLTINEELTQAAQLKANDMAEKGYFAHTSPEGVSPWYWIGLSGYQFLYAGENLAVDFSESVDVNRAWLNSPSHAANILSPQFTEIGIAIAEGAYKGKSTIFVAQMFGTPIPQIDTDVAGTQVVSSVEIIEGASLLEGIEPEIEVIVETETEEELFVAVENTEVPEEVVIDEGTIAPSAAPGYETYTKWYDFFVVHPQKTAEYALYIAAAIIALLLLFMVFVNFKVQHPRNLLYGFILLVLLLLAIYLNRIGLIQEIVSQFFL